MQLSVQIVQLAFSLVASNSPKGVTVMRPTHMFCQGLLVMGLMHTAAWAQPRAQLQAYVDQAQRVPATGAGQRFFVSRHGGEWSCASCHGLDPRQPGRHAATGRVIQALAPSANSSRFTDAVKAEKWFKRNCKDVLSRECTAGEKADVLAWLLTL